VSCCHCTGCASIFLTCLSFFLFLVDKALELDCFKTRSISVVPAPIVHAAFDSNNPTTNHDSQMHRCDFFAHFT
jgi:hypothetical protein